eukprot:gene34194-41392_t
MLKSCGGYWNSLYSRQCRVFAKQYASSLYDPSDLSSEGSNNPSKVFKLSRIYIPSKLIINREVNFSDEDVNYVKNVMRMNSGESLRVFNEQDGEFLARLTVIRERRSLQVSARIVSSLRRANLGGKPEVCLVFAPIKRDRTKIMLEKATELGVTKFQPIVTQHTNHDLDKVDSLQKVIIQSVEQSERLAPPPLLPTLSWSEYVLSLAQSAAEKSPSMYSSTSSSSISTQSSAFSSLSTPTRHSTADNAGISNEHNKNENNSNPPKHLVYICQERDTQIPSLYTHLSQTDLSSFGCISVVVGPEGGWAAGEVEGLVLGVGKGVDCVCVSLGEGVLRAETAALMALSLVMGKMH